jgi:hypothetical protein
LGAWYVASRSIAGAGASADAGGILDAIDKYGGLYGLHLDVDPHTRMLNHVYYRTPTPDIVSDDSSDDSPDRL